MMAVLRDVEGWTVDQKKLAGLIMAAFGLVIVEVTVGVLYADVGMMIDGLHAVFHVMSFCVSFMAMSLAAGEAAPRPFSYGYDRVEVLAAFTNGCFLMFVVVFLFVHVAHGGAGEDHDEHHHVSTNLWWMASARVTIMAVGIALFFKETQLSLMRVSKKDLYLTSHQENVGSCVIQMLGDIVVSVCFLISGTFLGQACWVEPMLSCVGAVIVFKLTVPLMSATGRVLLQGVPVCKSASLQSAIRDISFFDGVLNVVAWNLWSMSMSGDQNVIGTIELKVMADADAQQIVRRVRSALAPHVTDLTVQATRDVVLDWSVVGGNRNQQKAVLMQDNTPAAPMMTERLNRVASEVSIPKELEMKTLVV